MAVTKILARNGGLEQAIQYALNGDKTEGRILTAHQNCDPGLEYRQMMDTKRDIGKMDGRQCYHIIQSFKPGEVTPELALEIATEFASEYLTDYEVVIGTHVDKDHIHSHLVFNSVNSQTGKKYHVTSQEYYRQIRSISDRLCREHGLSVIVEGASSKAASYIEWLRQSKGQPTFRSMLEADLRTAIEDANDLGHFFMLMEHMGWEISHGNRLGFRLRGQDRFMIPGRKNPLFTEDGILAAIQNNLSAIEAGQRLPSAYRVPYRPYKKHPKYTGFLALYVHYLYILGKIEKRQYPPRMTPQLRKEVIRFECCREQFAFLRENNISTQEDMTAFQARTEDTLTGLMKRRTILNVRKKKRRALYDALADVEALAEAKRLYDEGLSGMEAEAARYTDVSALLDSCGIPRDRLAAEKVELYRQLAELNRSIRAERKKLALCKEVMERAPKMKQSIEKIEMKEVSHDEHRRR
nr:relaxase/mobilization nuclease domain-containing protein [uncultured Oscillibacter sp.]